MSGWNDFKADAEKVVSKVAVKTGELADAAAVRIKLQTLKLRLCEEYEKLGRAAYKASKSDTSVDTSAIIAGIDAIIKEIGDIKADISSK